MEIELQNVTVAIIGVRGYPSFYGGFETAIRKLVPALLSAGWKVRVYGREKPHKSRELNDSLSVIQTWGINSKRMSTLTFGLTATLHALIFKPDVVLILNVGNCIWLPLLKIRNLPCVVNVDGLEWKREKWGFVAKKVFLLGAKIAAHWADQLIFDSKEIEKYWLKIFKRTGTYIPYGGDIRTHTVEEGVRNLPFLLVVSRLVPENSIDLFLQVSEKIQELIPIVIVGNAAANSSYESRIVELISKYPRISWLGHLNSEAELNQLWQTATIYFHGHTVGGTNPALVQAMASGAAIIAIDTPFNREVLNDSGVFIDATSASIYQSVSELLKNPGRIASLKLSAIAEAKKRFTWDSVNNAYIDLLNDTLNDYSE